MKKLLLSLGTVAAIAAPVASVIACGSTPAGMGAALKGVKTLDVKTVQASTKLAAKDKTAAIAKINAAADVAALSAFMQTLTL